MKKILTLLFLCSSYLTTLQAAPDLIATNASTNIGSVAQGAVVQVIHKVKNVGNSSAITSKTRYYISTNNTYQTTDLLIGQKATNALGANASQLIAKNVTIPLTAPMGNVYLLVRVDALGAVAESNETNNVTAIPINIVANTPIADFVADANTICTGNAVNYINLSSNATSYQWYFEGGTPSSSTDPNPSVTYNSVGTYNVTLTATNASTSITETRTDYITVQALGSGYEPTNIESIYPSNLGSSINIIPSFNTLPITGDRIFYCTPTGIKKVTKSPLTFAGDMTTEFTNDAVFSMFGQLLVAREGQPVAVYNDNGSSWTYVSDVPSFSSYASKLSAMRGVSRDILLGLTTHGYLLIQYNVGQNIANPSAPLAFSDDIYTFGGVTNEFAYGGDIVQKYGNTHVWVGKGNKFVTIQINMTPTTAFQVMTANHPVLYETTLPSDIAKIINYQNYLYILMYNGQVAVYDVTNASPVFVRYINVPNLVNTGVMNLHTTASFGTLLEIGGNGTSTNAYNDMVIYSLSNPSDPSLVNFNIPPNSFSTSPIYNITSNDYGSTDKVYITRWGEPQCFTLFDNSGNCSVGGNKTDMELVAVPELLSLHLSPNPTTTETTLHYSLAETANTQIKVYDITGQLQQQYTIGQESEGEHTYTLSTAALPKGMYVVQLQTDKDVPQTVKLIRK
ncbi:MAG: T9SS type A sorting domain-containing protein [Chitinophagales bacterium]|nr:T9SS type A sorting domain-containing protein [Chitinophagales bacterium]